MQLIDSTKWQRGQIASNLGLFILLAKFTVEPGVYMKNITPSSAPLQSPPISPFFHACLPFLPRMSPRHWSHSHRNKRNKHSVSLNRINSSQRLPLPSVLIPMSNSCSPFISVAPKLLFDYLSYPSISGGIFHNLRTFMKQNKTITRACRAAFPAKCSPTSNARYRYCKNAKT